MNLKRRNHLVYFKKNTSSVFSTYIFGHSLSAFFKNTPFAKSNLNIYVLLDSDLAILVNFIFIYQMSAFHPGRGLYFSTPQKSQLVTCFDHGNVSRSFMCYRQKL